MSFIEDALAPQEGDSLFDSIDRNSYELFSKEFDDIKESLRKNILHTILKPTLLAI